MNVQKKSLNGLMRVVRILEVSTLQYNIDNAIPRTSPIEL